MKNFLKISMLVMLSTTVCMPTSYAEKGEKKDGMEVTEVKNKKGETTKLVAEYSGKYVAGGESIESVTKYLNNSVRRTAVRKDVEGNVVETVQTAHNEEKGTSSKRTYDEKGNKTSFEYSKSSGSKKGYQNEDGKYVSERVTEDGERQKVTFHGEDRQTGKAQKEIYDKNNQLKMLKVYDKDGEVIEKKEQDEFGNFIHHKKGKRGSQIVEVKGNYGSGVGSLFEQKEGTIEEFHKNGKLKKKINYIGNSKNLKSETIFKRNGKMKFDVNYNEDGSRTETKFGLFGMRDTMYDANGNKIGVQKYKKDGTLKQGFFSAAKRAERKAKREARKAERRGGADKETKGGGFFSAERRAERKANREARRASRKSK